MKLLVTGGAGFIGSHAVDRLIAEGHEVRVLDDLSTGDTAFLANSMDQIEFIEGSILDCDALDAAMVGVDAVWHIAANPEVRTGSSEPAVHVESHIEGTFAVLESMRKSGVKNLVFTSTSTVYGNATELPTPEHYGPLLPISIYGSCKLAAEALISSYCGTFAMNALLFRFANVVGPRSNHGVTYDFVHKLRANPAVLDILGDGTQHKSYVSVADTVDAMVYAFNNDVETGARAYNVGSADGIPVTTIADIVAEVMGLQPEYQFTGGTTGGAGWAGDVKHMGLAIDKLQSLGWEPESSSADAIRATAQWLIESS